MAPGAIKRCIPRALAVAALVLAITAASSCRRSASEVAAEPGPGDLEQVRAEVTRLFAAAARRDCIELATLGPQFTDPVHCEKFLTGWEERQVRLIRVEEARVDGRDRDAVIVRARVWRSGHEADMLVRAERADGAWILGL